MSSLGLPTPEQAYSSLIATGQQFPNSRSETLLTNVTYAHSEEGNRPITIDEDVLRAAGQVYVGDNALRAALWSHYVDTAPLEDAVEVLSGHLREDEWVWGFSGFTQGGINPATGEPYNYEVEAAGICSGVRSSCAAGQDPQSGNRWCLQ